MNRERRLFILSLVLSVGLASSVMVHADYSITEECAALLRDDDTNFVLFQSAKVIFDDPGPFQIGAGPTDAVEINGREEFCEDTNGNGKIDGTETCDRNGLWSGAVGDGIPLNGIGLSNDCNYLEGPGAFESLDTVADLGTRDNFCMVVENIDNNGVFVNVLLFTSVGTTGIALQIQDFAQSKTMEWIEPTKMKTICIDLRSDGEALVFRNVQGLGSIQNVPNPQNVTGLGFEFGAYTPNFSDPKCYDDNEKNDPATCFNKKPSGCGKCKITATRYQNRESDDIRVLLSQPRPEFELLTQDVYYCNAGTMSVSIKNDGTGTLRITKAILSNDNDFEVVDANGDPLNISVGNPFVVEALDTEPLRVRYNNLTVGDVSSTLKFESNALDPTDNSDIDDDAAENIADLHAFATFAQTIVTEQISSTTFIARINLELGVRAPVGRVDDGDGGFPPDCGKITQITSIASRLDFDPAVIEVDSVDIGRPNQPVAPNADFTELAPVPCCDPVPGSADPILNLRVKWDIDEETIDGRRLDIIGAGTLLGGAFINTADYTDGTFTIENPNSAEEDQFVLVECYSATFSLLDGNAGGCNTAVIEFVSGPANTRFPEGHVASYIGHNPEDGTAELQDVGARAASNLGIPANSFVRGDVDFSANVNTNDVVRMVPIIFDTDGSEAEVREKLFGQDCVAVVDITVDHLIDIRDLLTITQLAFQVGGNLLPADVEKLQPVQYTKNKDIVAPTVGYNKPGFEVQVKGGDKKPNSAPAPHPDRFTCNEGLDCANGI